MDMSKCMKRMRFAREWLENEAYNLWIEEVPHDNTKYYCSICKKSFSCQSRVSRHAETLTHRKNASSDCPERANETRTGYRRVFCPSWLGNPNFKPWLEQHPNDPYSCICTFCNMTFRCGLDSLQRHSDTKKHISECQKRGLTSDVNTPDESPLSFEDRVKVAEIGFAALIAERNIPFQAAEAILDCVKEIGKEPEVLRSMNVNRLKAPRIISNVLCAREQERVAETLQSTKFSIFVDETSDVTNDKWMTFLVRYVYPPTMNVRTELLQLIHLDASDCSAIKLFDAFKTYIWKHKIPFQNILALACDNASVMTGKHVSFKTKLQGYCKNLITMPCPCHASALVANAACAAIPEACEELLRKVATFINSSPKRATIFQQFQSAFSLDSRKILKLCDTRWLSRHACVVRLNANWDALFKFLQEEQANEKSNSGASILRLMLNPENRAYLLFLEYILDVFNKVNASFQAGETKVHQLQSAAENLLNIVLRNAVKPPLLDFVAMSKSNLILPDNRSSPNHVLVGEACQDYLDELTQEGQGELVQTVYAKCLDFYNIAATEIRQRLFVKEEFLSKLTVFEPKVALQHGDKEHTSYNSVEDVLVVAKRFGGFDEEMLRKEWISLPRDFASEQKDFLVTLDFDDAWKTILAKDKSSNLKYPALTQLVNAIRSLPNSNADAERTFSMLTDIKTKKRNTLSPTQVQALCVFKSCLEARGETARTMTVDARHLALMTPENLYKTHDKPNECFLRMFSADDGPSTSSDM